MIAVVIPSNRPERIVEWLRRWSGLVKVATVYVVEDGPSQSFNCGRRVRHLCWSDIDEDLGGNAWIIPRKTDCVRSYGYLAAFRDGAETIITLDDDCYPIEGMTPREFVEAHAAALATPIEEPAWQSTLLNACPRGMPYGSRTRTRECWLNHGLWENVPDFDAPRQLVDMRSPIKHEWRDEHVPAGRYLPMCGMNLAWRRELTPAMWFLLMGGEHPYDRFGDIWAGLFAKRICDHLGFGVRSGSPPVWHDRASNVWANLKKEAPGLELNESLWRTVEAVTLTETTVAGCYRQLADGLNLDGEYWLKVRRGMAIWADLTE